MSSLIPKKTLVFIDWKKRNANHNQSKHQMKEAK
jgi:hypothetical protein